MTNKTLIELAQHQEQFGVGSVQYRSVLFGCEPTLWTDCNREIVAYDLVHYIFQKKPQPEFVPLCCAEAPIGAIILHDGIKRLVVGHYQSGVEAIEITGVNVHLGVQTFANAIQRFGYNVLFECNYKISRDCGKTFELCRKESK